MVDECGARRAMSKTAVKKNIDLLCLRKIIIFSPIKYFDNNNFL